jgi:hypothetical protein
MSPDTDRRTLIVANRTASTPALLADVKRRAQEGATFALLIPARDSSQADWTADDAAAMLEKACGTEVDRVDCGSDPGATIKSLVEARMYDEIVVSTAADHHDHWFHHDLPHKVQDMGVAVTVIPPEPDSWGPIEGFPPEWVPHAVPGPGAY